MDAMEKLGIWPTATNYELFLHYAGDPDGPIGIEIERLLSAGEPLTESLTDELAAQFLPKQRLNDQIRDAGDQLSRELASVAAAINKAQKSSESFGLTLAKANTDLGDAGDAPAVQKLILTLAGATRKVQKENTTLEKRLAESTAEVTKLKDHLEQVRRDATTDSLTNLANRKAFDDAAENAVEVAEAAGKPLTLAVIDIDHFKSFNDTWGHQTGDQVIRFVASVLARVGAAPRFAARYGGEEFAMLFPNEDADQVAAVLDEVRIEIASRMLKRRSTNEDLGTITVSAGLAQHHPGESLHTLLDRADEALYASKRNGRNKVSSARDTAQAA
jgi:diguanylate cyclase